MAQSEQQYQLALQRFFDDENFHEMISRTKHEFFEEWQHCSNSDERDRIYAKLEVIEQLCNALRAAADSIAFEKQRQGLQ